MGKKFDREEREIERLQKDNRELKAEVRALSKRLKKVSKGFYKFLDDEDFAQKEQSFQKLEKEIKQICYNCGIGEYKKIIVGNRSWRQCQNCDKRGRVKLIDVD